MVQTALSLLHDHLSTRARAVEAFFAAQLSGKEPIVFHSVDIRYSGYKIAPVDCNLFPAGFNNLPRESHAQFEKYMRAFLEQHHPSAKKALLIIEHFTRNTYYLDNVETLAKLLTASGLEVALGSFKQDEIFYTAEGKALDVHALKNTGGHLETAQGFRPDIILLNNDMTGSLPEILEHTAQPVLPPPQLGWHTRRKSTHFRIYEDVVEEFAAVLEIDPWLLSAFSNRCGMVNFKERTGIDCVAQEAEKMLHGLRAKYAEYGIQDAPYVYVKADRGTFGMGIMTARSGEEILEMNKKIRNDMQKIKGGTLSTEVMIQEGVPTALTLGGHVAEPLVYNVAGEPFGMFYRVHHSKDQYGNLNSPHGMVFEHDVSQADLPPHLASISGLIARLSHLAVMREIRR